ncbi:hypothetical protein V8B97DRAFT_1967137 [Scleroderma yunnanense]
MGSMRDVASTSKVVLPPVSQLLGAVDSRGPHDYEIPVLPRLRLPDQPGEFSLPMGRDRTRTTEMPEAGPSTSATSKARGKKRQTEGDGDTEEETGEGKKSKAARKIYVACDFCRGRKLRCDGTKPSCSNCSTRSLVCKYQDHPRRRGPGKAPKGLRKKGEGKGADKKTSAKSAESESQLFVAGWVRSSADAGRGRTASAPSDALAECVWTEAGGAGEPRGGEREREDATMRRRRPAG